MSEQTPQQPAPAKPRNRRPLIIIGAVALLAIAGWALYYLTVARFRVGTDDAYVDGNLVRLTPQVAGTVTAINTDETQFVHRGQVLVQLDPRDTQVALAQAKASLAETVRDVAQLFAEEAAQRGRAADPARAAGPGEPGRRARPAADRPARRLAGDPAARAERGARARRRGSRRRRRRWRPRAPRSPAPLPRRIRACCRRRRSCARPGWPRPARASWHRSPATWCAAPCSSASR